MWFILPALSSLRLVPLQRFSLNFFANLIATLYMLIGSKKAFYWVKPTIWQFLLFASIGLASNLLFAWLSADDGSRFNVQGLISYLIWPIVMLVSGIVLANRHHNAQLLLVPAILWLVADALTSLVQSGIQLMGQYDLLPDWSYSILPNLFSVLFVWQALSLLWIFSRQLRWPWWERILISLGVMGVLFVWQQNVQSQPIFKVEPVETTMSEQAFYQQPILLNTALNDLQPERKGVHDWYFLGVAGDAEQDVFLSEIDQTKTLFDEKFGTAGRSLELINNAQTQADLPIASKTSIEMALNDIGKKLNPAEDILFLNLSSHGGDDGEHDGQKVLAMQNDPLELENIDPTWLRQTLDKSGIKWRVIVISACYSGAFIEQLQSPTTLIITASAKDKSSFGCSNEAQWTYFGQAFFAESLPKNLNFAKAFNEAKISIAKREQDMGFEPSDPQYVVGSEMQERLASFEQVLFLPLPTAESATAVTKTGGNVENLDNVQIQIAPEK